MKPIITVSEISTFADCRLRHDLYYNERLSTKRRPIFLDVGTCGHKFMEVLYLSKDKAKALQAFDDEFRKIKEEILRLKQELYDEDVLSFFLTKIICERYADIQFPKDMSKYVLKAIPEHEFFLETEHCYLAGKIDAIFYSIINTAYILVMDHKFLAGYDTERNMLLKDYQLSMYAAYIMHLYKLDMVEMLFNAIKKPKFVYNRKKYKTLESFRSYCASKIDEDPSKYFKRVEIVRSKHDMKRFLHNLNILIKGIIQNNDVSKKIVYENPQASCVWKCPFASNLCLEPDSQGYRESLFIIRDKRHAELNSGPSLISP